MISRLLPLYCNHSKIRNLITISLVVVIGTRNKKITNRKVQNNNSPHSFEDGQRVI
jgi:hypothetical protein